jgi:hypothetical protein
MNHICHTSITFATGSSLEEAKANLLIKLEDTNSKSCLFKHSIIDDGEDFYFDDNDFVVLTDGDVEVPHNVIFFNEDKSYISFGNKVKSLGNDEIAEHLLSDKAAYGEFMKEYLSEYLDKHSDKSIYWDAWFRGARGKDLEDADKGKVFKG